MDLIQLLAVTLIVLCAGVIYLTLRRSKSAAALRRIGTYGERLARHGPRLR